MKYAEPKKDELYPNCEALTYGDVEELMDMNEKCGWGFTAIDCLRFLADHIEANHDVESGNDPLEAHRKMESIEWRLEDANFHRLSECLSARNYGKAIEWIRKDYDELFGGV